MFKYKKTNLSDQLLTSYLELFIMTDNTNTMQNPELSQAASTQSNAALQLKHIQKKYVILVTDYNCILSTLDHCITEDFQT